MDRMTGGSPRVEVYRGPARLLHWLTVLLVAVQLTRGAPADEPTLEGRQRVVSHLNHWGLYLLLIGVPIAGYVGISMFPALGIFGLFTLPGVVAPEKDVATVAFRVHRALAFALVPLIVMHVAAALHHYVVRKDNVLGRMIPSLLRR